MTGRDTSIGGARGGLGKWSKGEKLGRYQDPEHTINS